MWPFRNFRKAGRIATHASEIFDSNITLGDYPPKRGVIETY
jgi:hypothetical protein